MISEAFTLNRLLRVSREAVRYRRQTSRKSSSILLGIKREMLYPVVDEQGNLEDSRISMVDAMKRLPVRIREREKL